MGRAYDSSRRKKVASKTRGEILQAALKLHWEGNTDYEQLALEAGCSLATVRKHFPNKETLFLNCTQAFAESFTLPDLTLLTDIGSAPERLTECIAELCRVHEGMFGYAWLAACERDNSPILDAVLHDYDRLTDGIAEIISSHSALKGPVVRGLLDFLTYRALRLGADLSPAQIKDELITTISMLNSMEKATSV